MSCQYPDCQESAEVVCRTCEENRNLCHYHIIYHIKTLKCTTFIPIIQEVLELKNEERLVKTEIEKVILKITKDAESIISAIKKASREAIQNLKETNLHIKKVIELKPTFLNEKRVAFFIEQTRNITKSTNISFEEEIEMLNSKNLTLIENIDQLNREKNEFLVKLNEFERERNENAKLLELERQRLLFAIKQNDDNVNKFGQDIVILKLEMEMKFEEKEREILSLRKILNDPTEIENILKNLNQKFEKTSCTAIEKKCRKNPVDPLKEFKNMDTSEKKQYIEKNWTFVKNIDQDDIEFLLSNDGLFLFRCN